MPCSCEGYPTEKQYMPMYLCAACRHLSVDQLKSIQPPGVINLLAWYADHIAADYRNNIDAKEKADALKEFERLNISYELNEDGSLHSQKPPGCMQVFYLFP